MTKSIWNCVAGVYDWFFAKPLNRDIPSLLKLGQFKTTDRVLDYGGGTGRVAEQLKDRVGEIIVADPAEKMLRQAQEKGLKTNLITKLPLTFDPETFDAILIIEALHHFKDPEAGLVEAYRLLKPGGILLVEEPHPKTWIRLALWIEGILEKVTFFTPESLRILLGKTGFSVEQYEFLEPSYFFKVKK